MADRTHSLGLLLGTEEDWPSAFEALVRRLDPALRGRRRHPPLRRRAHHHRAVRPAPAEPLQPGRRPAGVLVLRPARVAEEGRADGRRLPAQQPLHVPVDGEARGVLRDDPARAEGAGDLAGAAQDAAGQPAVPLHRSEVQPAVRPARGRRAGRLPALHEALRRRRVGGRHPHPGRGRPAAGLRRVGAAAHAPAGQRRGLRRLRPVAVDRRRDDGHALRARPAAARPLQRQPRLPRRGDRRRGRDDRQGRQRLLQVGVQLLRDARARRPGAPDRLRQRLPRRVADLAALLLPVGDDVAGEVVAVLHRDRPHAAGRPRHPALVRRRRRRAAPTRRSWRPTGGWPTTTSRPTATPSSSRRSSATSTRSPTTTSPPPTSTGCSSRRCRRRSRRTSTSSSSRTTAGCSAPGSRTPPERG